MPAIEGIDSRFKDFKFDIQSVIADNTSAARYVVGGAPRRPGGLDLRVLGVVMERNGDVVHVFADTPPHFETRTAHQRVYVGADSYELMERVSEVPDLSGYCVEMGSGSGVQLIAALKQYPAITKAIGTERDRRRLSQCRSSTPLNGVDDRMAVGTTRTVCDSAQGHPICLR
jgi:hypothetical protein